MKKLEAKLLETIELRLGNYYGSVFIRKYSLKNKLTYTIFLTDYDVDLNDSTGIEITEDLYNKLYNEISIKSKK